MRRVRDAGLHGALAGLALGDDEHHRDLVLAGGGAGYRVGGGGRRDGRALDHRLDRHHEGGVVGGHAHLGARRHAGAQSVVRALEQDLDAEELDVGLLGLGVAGAADLDHASLVAHFGERVDLDRRGEPGTDVDDLGLVHVDLGQHLREVRDGADHRRGVVHRARDDHLPLFGVERDDPPADRSVDGRLAQVVVGFLEQRPRLADALARRAQPQLGRGMLELCGFEGLFRGDTLAVEALGAGEPERLIGERDLRLLELGRGHGEPSARVVASRQVGLLLEAQKGLPRLDRVAFAHVELFDLADHVRRDVDLDARIDLSAGAHGLRDAALGDAGGVDLDGLAPGAGAHARDHHDDEQERDTRAQPQFPLHAPPLRFRRPPRGLP
ncbi:MAG: hypothetical protein H6Q03_3 [Acidobacteria bacterium]|nr:hypothetical protein [Acidobacteriota bacterium]